MADESKLTTAKTFPGITNLVPEESLRVNSLREAVNVDLVGDPELGIHPRLREGRRPFVADVGAHSLWCDRAPFALYVNGAGELKALFPDRTTQVLVTGLSVRRVSYDLINDRIYWSNGQQCGLITLGLETLPWAVEGPPATPVCAPDAAGGLDAGTYQVAVTFVDATGRESGTGVAQGTLVEAGGGVLLSSIPQPADPVAVPIIRIYVTKTNGDVLYRHQDVASGTTDFLITARPSGAPIQTQMLFIMPPGHIVRSLNGIQLVARGRELLFSPGLRYGMVDPARGRIGFPGKLDLVEPVTGGSPGVFVAAGDRTYFLTGSNLNTTAEVGQRIVRMAGAVPGSSCRVGAEMLGLDMEGDVPVWLSKTGHFCASLPGGRVIAFNLPSAVTDGADAGAMMFRETNGHRKLIAALSGPKPQALAARDRVSVREYRHDQEAQ